MNPPILRRPAPASQSEKPPVSCETACNRGPEIFPEHIIDDQCLPSYAHSPLSKFLSSTYSQREITCLKSSFVKESQSIAL
jgi:hypothetical protein